MQLRSRTSEKGADLEEESNPPPPVRCELRLVPLVPPSLFSLCLLPDVCSSPLQRRVQKETYPVLNPIRKPSFSTSSPPPSSARRRRDVELNSSTSKRPRSRSILMSFRRAREIAVQAEVEEEVEKKGWIVFGDDGLREGRSNRTERDVWPDVRTRG